MGGYTYRVSRDLRDVQGAAQEHVLPTRECFRLLAAENVLVVETRDLSPIGAMRHQAMLGVKALRPSTGRVRSR